jgi:hypothetical protein
MSWWPRIISSGYQALVLTVLVFAVAVTHAQVMTSGNYAIVSDSINVGGGNSTSTNYRQESTFGEIATGNSTSTNYNLHGGYQQMQEVFLSLSGVTSVTMSPTLGGLTGGTADGSTTVTVLTDNLAGYSLTLVASQAPAMQTSGGQTIANYVPASAVPDFTFTVASDKAYFGVSPEGVDVAARYKDNGSVCNTGVLDTAVSCWDMVSTTAQQIAVGNTANHPNGATTTLRFRLGVGVSAGVIAGSYQATTTITALTL